MRPILFLVFFLTGLPAWAAQTHYHEFSITFDMVKTEHTCHGKFPRPEDGTCGLYQELELGKSYQGSIDFSGWLTYGSRNSYGATFDVFPRMSLTCLFDGRSCFTASGLTGHYSDTGFSMLPIISYWNADFSFSGPVGEFKWEDDGDPWGKGRFALSNVVVTGNPPTPPQILSTPLPASLYLLGLPLTLLAWRVRRIASAHPAP